MGCYQQVNAGTFISALSLTAELVISEGADTASSHPDREVIVVLSWRLYTQLWLQLTSSLIGEEEEGPWWSTGPGARYSQRGRSG